MQAKNNLQSYITHTLIGYVPTTPPVGPYPVAQALESMEIESVSNVFKLSIYTPVFLVTAVKEQQKLTM